jgi:hypothetical protein
MECQVCINQMSTVKRKLIKCMYCDFEACLECCKTYILEQSTPHCMNIGSCSREWTRKFLSANFPQSFLTSKYKIHRENILLEQERALFVETQPYVTNQILLEKNYEKMNKISIEIVALNSKYEDLLSEQRKLSQKTVHERQQFVRSCPKNECNGFLNQQWKCGICETKYCKHCHQPLENNKNGPAIFNLTNNLTNNLENVKNEFIETNEIDVGETHTHVCNEADLATAKLLEKDTKPCPKCNIGIFKIDGCNQMFCTKCNTAFDWVTRKIMNVNIHNPHYFEWLRRQETVTRIPTQATNPNDCPVFNEITNTTSRSIVQLVKAKLNLSESQKNEMLDNVLCICRNILHIRQVIMPIYTTDYVEKNRNLRILLMRNKISETAFKSQIQKNEKKHAKYQEIYNVFQLLVNGISDIVLRYIESLRITPYTFNEETRIILKEIEPLVNYANECFAEISFTYKSKIIRVNSNLQL